MKIKLDKRTIGSLLNVKTDMFHIYGQFVEGPHYSDIKAQIEALERLWKKSEHDGLSETEEQRYDLLREEIDKMDLKEGTDSDGYSKIRDFIVIDGICEYKIDQ